jgi:hypothetical protein
LPDLPPAIHGFAKNVLSVAKKMDPRAPYPAGDGGAPCTGPETLSGDAETGSPQKGASAEKRQMQEI